MKLTRIHYIAVTVVAVALVPLLWFLIDRHFNPPAPAPNPRVTEEWQQRFDAVYALRKDETAKLVAPPFIPERAKWIAQNSRQAMEGKDPDRMVLQWNGEELSEYYVNYGNGGTVGSAVRTATQLPWNSVDIPQEILRRPMPGDWVVREPASLPQRIAAFEKELSKLLGAPAKLTLRQVERDVIIASGTFKFTPMSDPSPPDQTNVQLFHKTLGRNGGTMNGNVSRLLIEVGNCLRRPIMAEGVSPTDVRVSWYYHDDVRPRAFANTQPSGEVADEVLANVAKQTGLKLKREKRVLGVWVLDQPRQAVGTTMSSPAH